MPRQTFGKTEEKQHILGTMLHLYPQPPESMLAVDSHGQVRTQKSTSSLSWEILRVNDYEASCLRWFSIVHLFDCLLNANYVFGGTRSLLGTVTEAKFLVSIKFIFTLNGGGWKILSMLGKKKDPGDEVLYTFCFGNLMRVISFTFSSPSPYPPPINTMGTHTLWRAVKEKTVQYLLCVAF